MVLLCKLVIPSVVDEPGRNNCGSDPVFAVQGSDCANLKKQSLCPLCRLTELAALCQLAVLLLLLVKLAGRLVVCACTSQARLQGS